MLSMTLLVGTILALLVLTSLSRSSEQTAKDARSLLALRSQGARVDARLREVCRSVLNTNSLRFVAANAPAEVVSSYGTEQQRLARLSLQVASAVLVQRLAHDGGS